MTSLNEEIHDLQERNADLAEELEAWRARVEKMEQRYAEMEDRALHAESLCEAAVEGLRVYHEHVNAKAKNPFAGAWEGTN